MHILDTAVWFPPADEAEHDGLLAVGGDLSVERLCLAYANGIFPWYVGTIPLWWCPNPRFVLFPGELQVGKRLKKSIGHNDWVFTHNQCFDEVIEQCASIKRNGQDSTWITKAMIEAFIKLHGLGIATSFELWQDKELVGGLYGIWAGNVFCGESMFSKIPGASKIAFVKAVEWLSENGVKLIDCQVHTDYLESMGARFIERGQFLDLLHQNHAEVILKEAVMVNNR